MAKYKKVFNTSQLEEIKSFASIGLPDKKIADKLSMSESTFDRAMKYNTALRKAMNEGRAQVSANVRGSLYERAMQSRTIKKKKFETKWNPEKKEFQKICTEEHEIEIPANDALLQFWCNTQEDFKVKTGIEISGPGGRPIEAKDVSPEDIKKELEKLRKLTK